MEINAALSLNIQNVQQHWNKMVNLVASSFFSVLYFLNYGRQQLFISKLSKSLNFTSLLKLMHFCTTNIIGCLRLTLNRCHCAAVPLFSITSSFFRAVRLQVRLKGTKWKNMTVFANNLSSLAERNCHKRLQSINRLLLTAVREEREEFLDLMKQSFSSASHLMSLDSPNTAHTFHLCSHLELLFIKPMCTSHPTTHLFSEKLFHEGS